MKTWIALVAFLAIIILGDLYPFFGGIVWAALIVGIFLWIVWGLIWDYWLSSKIPTQPANWNEQSYE